MKPIKDIDNAIPEAVRKYCEANCLQRTGFTDACTYIQRERKGLLERVFLYKYYKKGIRITEVFRRRDYDSTYCCRNLHRLLFGQGYNADCWDIDYQETWFADNEKKDCPKVYNYAETVNPKEVMKKYPHCGFIDYYSRKKTSYAIDKYRDPVEYTKLYREHPITEYFAKLDIPLQLQMMKKAERDEGFRMFLARHRTEIAKQYGNQVRIAECAYENGCSVDMAAKAVNLFSRIAGTPTKILLKRYLEDKDFRLYARLNLPAYECSSIDSSGFCECYDKHLSRIEGCYRYKLRRFCSGKYSKTEAQQIVDYVFTNQLNPGQYISYLNTSAAAGIDIHNTSVMFPAIAEDHKPFVISENAGYRVCLKYSVLNAAETMQITKYCEENKIPAGTYIAYFDMVFNLHLNFHDSKILCPHDFYMSYELREEEKAAAERAARKSFADKYHSVMLRYNSWAYTDGKYQIVVPQNISDLKKEGEGNNNCVGRSTYDEKTVKGQSAIFFLRKAEAPDVSFVTVEIDPNKKTILQCRGYHNADPDEEVNVFAQQWIAQVPDIIREPVQDMAAVTA